MKVNVVKIAMLGVLASLSIVLMLLIRFPILPVAPFLEYEPADIVVLIGSFLYGPLEGLLLAVIVSVIQTLTVSSGAGWVGMVMHIISSGTLAISAGLVYKKLHTKKGALFALITGTVCMTAIMIPANLFFTVRFWGFPREQVIDLLLPAFIPFNLIKAGVNSAVVFLIYKPVSKAFDMIHARNGR